VFLTSVAFACWVALYFHASLLLAILRSSKFLGFGFQYASNEVFHREKNNALPTLFRLLAIFNVACGEESDDLRGINQKEPRLLAFPFCIKLASATATKGRDEGVVERNSAGMF